MNTETTKQLQNKPGAWIAITTDRNRMNTETTKQLQGKLIETCDAMLGLVNMSSEQLVKIVSLERELAETKAEAKKWEKLHDQDTEHLASLQKRDNYGPTETLNETAMRLSGELAEVRMTIDDVCRVIAKEHEGPRLAAMRIVDELAEARKMICEMEGGVRETGFELYEARKQRDTLAEALRRIMKITIPDQNMPYCKNDRIYSIAKESLAAVKGGEA